MVVAKTRYGGARHLLSLLPPLIKPVLKRRGFQSGTLFMDWPMIVGPDMARLCRPERLTFPKDRRDQGTLILVAYDGAAALFLQHALDLILDHINRHFGYGAVARIRIIQRPDGGHLLFNKTDPAKPHNPTDNEKGMIEPFEERYPLPSSPAIKAHQSQNHREDQARIQEKTVLEKNLKSLYEHWIIDQRRS